MPANYPALIFGSLPLLSGGPDPTKPNHSYQHFDTQLFCGNHYPALIGVDHSNLPCAIDHYVPEGEPAPVENSLAYCSGTFQVLIEDKQPQVKIRTVRLQR
jgi:hypothetical protein